jgi:rhamnosyltransferase
MMNVCAILVTYHPDAEFPERLRGIGGQVAAVVIVDNGSGDAELRMLQEIAADPAITLISNSANLGIARALNIGIQRAATLKFRWVLLFDQDSVVDGDMVETLCAAADSFCDEGRLAIVGSNYRYRHGEPSEPVKSQLRGEQWEEVEWVITSGSLLSLAAYADIGPFREEFFIDYVDIDYCIRARAHGYRIIKTRRQVMSHSIGQPTQHDLLWMKKSTTNHSADRRYYMARNDTVMLREHGNYRIGGWALKSFLRRVRSCKRILLYEQAKLPKIGAVCQGWWDGVRGRMGPRNKRRSA